MAVSITSDELESICTLPRAVPRASLRNAVSATGYRELRPLLTRDAIAGFLSRHPGLVREWLRYSEDKRTSGGWYLLHPTSGWIVGRLAGPEEERELRFGSGAEACAEFILRELDSVVGEPADAPRSG